MSQETQLSTGLGRQSLGYMPVSAFLSHLPRFPSFIQPFFDIMPRRTTKGILGAVLLQLSTDIPISPEISCCFDFGYGPLAFFVLMLISDLQQTLNSAGFPQSDPRLGQHDADSFNMRISPGGTGHSMGLAHGQPIYANRNTAMLMPTGYTGAAEVI